MVRRRLSAGSIDHCLRTLGTRSAGKASSANQLSFVSLRCPRRSNCRHILATANTSRVLCRISSQRTLKTQARFVTSAFEASIVLLARSQRRSTCRQTTAEQGITARSASRRNHVLQAASVHKAQCLRCRAPLKGPSAPRCRSNRFRARWRRTAPAQPSTSPAQRGLTAPKGLQSRSHVTGCTIAPRVQCPEA